MGKKPSYFIIYLYRLYFKRKFKAQKLPILVNVRGVIWSWTYFFSLYSELSPVFVVWKTFWVFLDHYIQRSLRWLCCSDFATLARRLCQKFIVATHSNAWAWDAVLHLIFFILDYKRFWELKLFITFTTWTVIIKTPALFAI